MTLFTPALRAIRRDRTTHLGAVILIGLGVALTAGVFSVLDAVVLRPLRVPQPERLANVQATTQAGEARPVRLSLFERIRSMPEAEAALAWSGTVVAVQANGATTPRVSTIWVTGDYYRILGGVPLLGRYLDSSDDGPVAVISEDFWRSHLDADRAVLGKQIRAGSVPVTVVGVAPHNAVHAHRFLRPGLVVPLRVGMALEGLHDGSKAGQMPLEVTLRLAAGVRRESFEAKLRTLWDHWVEQTVPAGMALNDWRARVWHGVRVADGSRGMHWFGSNRTQPLYVLFALAAVVAAAICANLSALVLAHALSRSRETAIRLALGARRRRLAVEAFAGACVLAVPGVILGVAGSKVVANLALGFLPASDAIDFGVAAIGARAVVFASALGLIIAIAGQVGPAMRVSRVDAAQAIKYGDPAVNSKGGIRRVLLALQVASCVVLLMSSAAFAGTLRNIATVPLGYERTGLAAAMIAGSPPFATVGRDYFEALLADVRSIPGVESASIMGNAPMERASGLEDKVTAEGAAAETTAYSDCMWRGAIGTLGVGLLRGDDVRPGGAIVSAELARALFGDADAAGRQVRAGTRKMQISGVIPDVQVAGPRQGHRRVLYSDCRDVWTPPQTRFAVSLVIRSPLAPAALERELRARIDGRTHHSVFFVKTVEQLIERQTEGERMLLSVSSMLATSAAAVTAVGLYSLVAFGVTRRRREIGIRMAVGAPPREVVLLFVKEIVVVIAVGCAAGFAAAAGLGHLVEKFVFGVRPADVQPALTACTLMLAIGVVAAWFPARKAGRLDPAGTLRSE